MPIPEKLGIPFNEIIKECERHLNSQAMTEVDETLARKLNGKIENIQKQIEDYKPDEHSAEGQWREDALKTLQNYSAKAQKILHPIDGSAIEHDRLLEYIKAVQDKYERGDYKKNPEALKLLLNELENLQWQVAEFEKKNADSDLKFGLAQGMGLDDIHNDVKKWEKDHPISKKRKGHGVDFANELGQAVHVREAQIIAETATIGSSPSATPATRSWNPSYPGEKSPFEKGIAILDKTPGGKEQFFSCLVTPSHITKITCKAPHFSQLKTTSEKDIHIRNLERMLLAYVVGRGADDKSPVLINGEDEQSRTILAKLCKLHHLEYECPLGIKPITNPQDIEQMIQRNAVNEAAIHPDLPADLQLPNNAASPSTKNTDGIGPPPPIPTTEPPEERAEGNYRPLPVGDDIWVAQQQRSSDYVVIPEDAVNNWLCASPYINLNQMNEYEKFQLQSASNAYANQHSPSAQYLIPQGVPAFGTAGSNMQLTGQYGNAGSEVVYHYDLAPENLESSGPSASSTVVLHSEGEQQEENLDPQSKKGVLQQSKDLFKQLQEKSGIENEDEKNSEVTPISTSSPGQKT